MPKLLRGPVIQMLQTGADQRVIEDPSDAALVAEVDVEISSEGIALGKHSAQGEKYPGHAQARVAEQGTQGGQPAER